MGSNAVFKDRSQVIALFVGSSRRLKAIRESTWDNGIAASGNHCDDRSPSGGECRQSTSVLLPIRKSICMARDEIASPAAGRQSHELGAPTDDQRLPGADYDSSAGVRDSSQHSGAAPHTCTERCCYCFAGVGDSGPDVDGSELR